MTLKDHCTVNSDEEVWKRFAWLQLPLLRAYTYMKSCGCIFGAKELYADIYIYCNIPLVFFIQCLLLLSVYAE